MSSFIKQGISTSPSSLPSALPVSLQSPSHPSPSSVHPAPAPAPAPPVITTTATALVTTTATPPPRLSLPRSQNSTLSVSSPLDYYFHHSHTSPSPSPSPSPSDSRPLSTPPPPASSSSSSSSFSAHFVPRPEDYPFPYSYSSSPSAFGSGSAGALGRSPMGMFRSDSANTTDTTGSESEYSFGNTMIGSAYVDVSPGRETHEMKLGGLGQGQGQGQGHANGNGNGNYIGQENREEKENIPVVDNDDDDREAADGGRDDVEALLEAEIKRHSQLPRSERISFLGLRDSNQMQGKGHLHGSGLGSDTGGQPTKKQGDEQRHAHAHGHGHGQNLTLDVVDLDVTPTMVQQGQFQVPPAFPPTPKRTMPMGTRGGVAAGTSPSRMQPKTSASTSTSTAETTTAAEWFRSKPSPSKSNPADLPIPSEPDPEQEREPAPAPEEAVHQPGRRPESDSEPSPSLSQPSSLLPSPASSEPHRQLERDPYDVTRPIGYSPIQPAQISSSLTSSSSHTPPILSDLPKRSASISRNLSEDRLRPLPESTTYTSSRQSWATEIETPRSSGISSSGFFAKAQRMSIPLTTRPSVSSLRSMSTTSNYNQSPAFRTGSNRPWPSAMLYSHIKVLKTPGSRALEYAKAINELATADSGLQIWVQATKVKAIEPIAKVDRRAKAVGMRNLGLASPSPSLTPTFNSNRIINSGSFSQPTMRIVSDASAVAFPTRSDAGQAVEIQSRLVDDSNPPDALPANLPYPALAEQQQYLHFLGTATGTSNLGMKPSPSSQSIKSVGMTKNGFSFWRSKDKRGGGHGHGHGHGKQESSPLTPISGPIAQLPPPPLIANPAIRQSMDAPPQRHTSVPSPSGPRDRRSPAPRLLSEITFDNA